jgi:hypothetical protein
MTIKLLSAFIGVELANKPAMHGMPAVPAGTRTATAQIGEYDDAGAFVRPFDQMRIADLQAWVAGLPDADKMTIAASVLAVETHLVKLAKYEAWRSGQITEKPF